METASKEPQLWGDTAVEYGATLTSSLFTGQASGGDITLLSGSETADYESVAKANSDGRERKVSSEPARSHASPRERVGVILAVFLLAGLTAAILSIRASIGLRAVRKTDAEKPGPTLPLILKPSYFIQYENALLTASKELEETWQRSSGTVKQAFTKHFIPEMEMEGKELPQEPVALLQQRVEIMRGIQQPLDSDDEQKKREYALQLLLTRAVITAATSRLNSLTELEKFCKERGIGSELLDLPMPKLPPAEELAKQEEDLISFPKFLKIIDREVDRSSRRQADKQIPKKLAQTIADLILAGDMRAKADREARNIFHDFLDLLSEAFPAVDETGGSSGLEMLPMPGEYMPFPTRIFSAYVSAFDRTTTGGCISPEDLGFFALKWTVQGAVDQVEMLQDKEGEWLRQLHHSKHHHLANWKTIIKVVKESKRRAYEEHDQKEAEGILSLALALL